MGEKLTRRWATADGIGRRAPRSLTSGVYCSYAELVVAVRDQTNNPENKTQISEKFVSWFFFLFTPEFSFQCNFRLVFISGLLFPNQVNADCKRVRSLLVAKIRHMGMDSLRPFVLAGQPLLDDVARDRRSAIVTRLAPSDGDGFVRAVDAARSAGSARNVW